VTDKRTASHIPAILLIRLRKKVAASVVKIVSVA